MGFAEIAGAAISRSAVVPGLRVVQQILEIPDVPPVRVATGSRNVEDDLGDRANFGVPPVRFDRACHRAIVAGAARGEAIRFRARL